MNVETPNRSSKAEPPQFIGGRMSESYKISVILTNPSRIILS